MKSFNLFLNVQLKGSQFILAAFFCLIIAFGAEADEKFVPIDDKRLLIIGQDQKSIEDYIKETGHSPAGFMVYTSLQDLDGLATASDRGSGIQHAQYLIDKYHNNVLQIGLYIVGILDDIADGKYDKNIQKLGEWIDQAKVPVFLRIGYECDLPQNNYAPENYVKAYQHIVDQLRALGVKNVAFVWHATGHPVEGKRLTDWYPGDEYVDWVGLSFFYIYNLSDYEAVAYLARKQDKPLLIAEATPSQLGALNGQESWRKWYKPFFNFIQKHHIKVISYINTNWDSAPMFALQYWGDSRVEENAIVKEKWLSEIKHSRYIRSDYNIFKNLN